MDKKTVGIIAGIVLAIVLIIAFIFMNKGKNVETPSDNSTNNANVSTQSDSSTDSSSNGSEPVALPPTSDPFEEHIIVPDISISVEEPDTDPNETPVYHYYNKEYDKNNDGSIDKSEWEAWVAEHPEDLNQDMDIQEEEKQVYEETDEDDDARLEFKPMTPEEKAEADEKYDDEHQEEYRQAIIDAGLQDDPNEPGIVSDEDFQKMVEESGGYFTEDGTFVIPGRSSASDFNLG